jgi:hypothetical protein
MQERRYRAWAFGSSATLLGLGVLAVGCGGEDLSCGAGTKQDGEVCVAVQATGGNGGSPDGGGGSGGGGTTPNAAPAFAGVTSVAPASDVSLQVTWQAASDDMTAAEDMVYRVYVATASGEQNFATPTATSLPGKNSLLVPNLNPNASYFVVVRAVDAEGLADDNTAEKQGTPELDATAPTFAGVKATATVGATSVEVSWDTATDDKTPPEGISYTVLWSATQAGAVSGRVGVLTEPGATKAVVSNLPDAQSQFFFTVRARDAAGNLDANEAVVAGSTGNDETPPEFGGCTAVSQPGATTAVVSWNPAKDDTTRPEDITYNVYVFTSPVDDETPFGGIQNSFTGATTGEVTRLSPTTRYYFVCRAEDKHANEEKNIAFQTLLTLSDSTPPVFGGLETVTVESTSAELSWSEATDDKTAAGKIVYAVYQATAADQQDFAAPPVAESNPGTTAITLTQLQPNTEYFWVVRARDEASNLDQNTLQVSDRTLVSFARNVQPILNVHCVKVGCHNSVNPPQGLNMEEGFAYFMLVNVPATWDPTNFVRVKPGFPDESYIYMKDTGAAGILGQKMPPLGNEPPTADMLTTMRLWILQGAKNN